MHVIRDGQSSKVPNLPARLGARSLADRHGTTVAAIAMALLVETSAMCSAGGASNKEILTAESDYTDPVDLRQFLAGPRPPLADEKRAEAGILKATLSTYRHPDPGRALVVLACFIPGLIDRELLLDEGFGFVPSSVIFLRPGPIIRASWRQGSRTCEQDFDCSGPQLQPLGPKKVFENDGNATVLGFETGSRAVRFSTAVDSTIDQYTSIVVREGSVTPGQGPTYDEPIVLVPAEPGRFVDQLVVAESPLTNSFVLVNVEGPLPYDNTTELILRHVDDNFAAGPPQSLSPTISRSLGGQITLAGTGKKVVTATALTGAGTTTTVSAVFDTAGLAPAPFRAETSLVRRAQPRSALPIAPGSRQENSGTALGFEASIFGSPGGGSHYSSRSAPGGHDSVVVIGLAAEPPSFEPRVKARLIHGDGSLGAIKTFEFPPYIQAVVAIPVTGYRNELYVSLADTLLPDEDSGLYRFPLTIDHPPCQANDTTLCLNGGRFKVELAWRDEDGRGGAGHAKPLTGDTGTFWIFDPNNLEAVVKVLDAQVLNDHFWIFASGLTNIGIGITVTDTETGQFATFFNTLGQAFAPYQNTQALPGDNLPAEVGWMDRFAAPTGDRPRAGAASGAMHRPRGATHARSSRSSTAACTADATKLCLAGGRFEVSATFETAQGQSGAAQTAAITADTGYLWFFDQDNVEVLIKVLDACVINQRFWVFAGGLTDVKVVLTVRDSVTGQVRTYTNPLGTAFQPIQDTGAFATCS